MTVGLYGIYEKELRLGAAAGNPFDLRVRGVFACGGRRTSVDGFYDGDGTWRLRFMPTAVGRWQVSVYVDDRPGERAAFDCEPSDLPGPLRVDPEHPHHFRHEDGTRLYVMGNTAYNAVCACRNDRSAFLRFLDYYVERRFNWFRFFLQQTTWPTSGGVIWPFGGTPEEPDFTTFSLDTFRHAETVVRELAARRAIASVILLHPHDESLQKSGSERVAVCARYIRYAVARLGACWNVVWNLANEWQRGKLFTYDEMDELGRLLHAVDPCQRLTACHHYGRFEFHESEWTDMSSLQARGTPFENNRFILQNRFFGKPVLNEEYGYEGDNHSPPNDPDNVRRDHWAIALAGGYGTYGDKTKGPKIAVYFSSLLEDAVGTAVPDQLRHLQAFFSEIPWWTMEPANCLLVSGDPQETFCLARPGYEYVVYACGGGGFALNLTHVNGRLEAAWRNPLTGARRGAAEIDLRWPREMGAVRGRNSVAFESPQPGSDWVLHLRRIPD